MTPKKAAALVKKHGSIGAAAEHTTECKTTIRDAYAKAVELGLADKRPRGGKRGASDIGKVAVGQGVSRRGQKAGYLVPRKAKRLRAAKGVVRYHLFTSAQNNTKVHPQFWLNLLAFKEYLGATLHVARITYNKSVYGAQPTKDGKTARGHEEMWWDAGVVPYLDDSRLDVTKTLRWCGDMDILPTAVRPLSGLETYTGRMSSIFPHPKIALESVPGSKGEDTKLIMTTGSVTLRNYIQRKTGMKADFHHCFGAVLVEVDEDGNWFPRHINADSDGSFFDLDRFVSVREVSTGNRVEAIYWADPQIVEEDPERIAVAFGEGGMKDCLRPYQEFMGDVGSFKSRSHWDMKDPYKRFIRFQQGLGDVKKEGQQIAAFLKMENRPWCQTNILDGNHERHIGRWLREHNGIGDPVNAEVWTDMQSTVLQRLKEDPDNEPNYLDILLGAADPHFYKSNVVFRLRDESVIVCKNHGGGVECGEHGDDGTNGSRGSTASHAKSGRKKCLGHAWAQIYDGIYRSSSFSRAGMDWAHGNTSMNTCASVIIYPNGKRTLNFIYKGKWRA